MDSYSVEKDITYIKDWLKKEPHLPNDFDDHRIRIFLRGCKYSLEKCKRKLDMYFTMRSALPEFFTHRDISRPELQEIIRIMQISPLPKLTPEKRRVILMRGVERNVQPPNVANAFKVALMSADLRLKEESEEVDGDVFILDAAVATVNHFARFTPMLIKKFLLCVQEAYPIKLKQVHVINISPIVEKIVNFVMPFLKEKIRQRIFVHADVNDLYKHVPQEIMPTDYGGKVGSMNDIHHAWIKKTEECKDWFLEQDKYKSDESRRPGKPKNHDELFGLAGSFRQLDID